RRSWWGAPFGGESLIVGLVAEDVAHVVEAIGDAVEWIAAVGLVLLDDVVFAAAFVCGGNDGLEVDVAGANWGEVLGVGQLNAHVLHVEEGEALLCCETLHPIHWAHTAGLGPVGIELG